MGMKPRTYDYVCLDVTASYSEELIEEPCGDGWDRGVTRCELTGVSATINSYKVTWDPKKHKDDATLPNKGDVIYVVLEIADTGDTFGRDENVPYVRTWFTTREEADAYIEGSPPTNGFFDRHVEWRIEPVVVS